MILGFQNKKIAYGQGLSDRVMFGDTASYNRDTVSVTP